MRARTVVGTCRALVAVGQGKEESPATLTLTPGTYGCSFLSPRDKATRGGFGVLATPAHSVLKARIGSVLAARCAGTRLAATATTVTVTRAPANVSRSPGPTP